MTHQPYGNQPQGPPNRPYQPYIQPRRQSPQPQSWQPPQSQQQPYGPYGGYGPSGGAYAGHSVSARDLPLAPIHRRAGARLLDSVIAWAFGFAVVFPIVVGTIGLTQGAAKDGGGGTPWTTSALVTFFICVCVLPFIYETGFLVVWGQTLGKRFLGLRVVDVEPAGDPIGTPKAVWRSLINNVGYQLPVFFFLLLGLHWEFFLFGIFLAWIGILLSYLWAIWDEPLHQSIHDRFAGTVVVDDREYEEYDDDEDLAG